MLKCCRGRLIVYDCCLLLCDMTRYVNIFFIVYAKLRKQLTFKILSLQRHVPLFTRAKSIQYFQIVLLFQLCCALICDSINKQLPFESYLQMYYQELNFQRNVEYFENIMPATKVLKRYINNSLYIMYRMSCQF